MIIDSTNYNMAGDDCVRYIFTCLNATYSDFVYYIEKYSGYEWRDINTYLLCGNDIKIANAMSKCGFKIFETDLNKSFYPSNIRISEINEKFQLLRGDILVREGHAHIYLGNSEEKALNFGWGKVNRSFPSLREFKLAEENGKYYYTINNDCDKNGNFYHYTRIYRYVGGSK